MSVIAKINEKLIPALQPEILTIRDDSHLHAGHAGARPEGETHFHLTIKSDALKNKSRPQQHRMIYKLLEEELANGLHALQINVLDN